MNNLRTTLKDDRVVTAGNVDRIEKDLNVLSGYKQSNSAGSADCFREANISQRKRTQLRVSFVRVTIYLGREARTDEASSSTNHSKKVTTTETLEIILEVPRRGSRNGGKTSAEFSELISLFVALLTGKSPVGWAIRIQCRSQMTKLS